MKLTLLPDENFFVRRTFGEPFMVWASFGYKICVRKRIFVDFGGRELAFAPNVEISFASNVQRTKIVTDI